MLLPSGKATAAVLVILVPIGFLSRRPPGPASPCRNVRLEHTLSTQIGAERGKVKPTRPNQIQVVSRGMPMLCAGNASAIKGFKNVRQPDVAPDRRRLRPRGC